MLEQRVEERTRELRARTAWAEAILRSTSDGIIVTDAGGDITDLNPVALSLAASQPSRSRRSDPPSGHLRTVAHHTDEDSLQPLS